jgi:hypothetical protein
MSLSFVLTATDMASNSSTLHKANTLVRPRRSNSRNRAHTLKTSTHKARMPTVNRSKGSNTAPQTQTCRLKVTEASWVL